MAQDHRLLVDAAYLAEKGEIMSAVDAFIDLVNQRTLGGVERVRRDGRQLFLAQIARGCRTAGLAMRIEDAAGESGCHLDGLRAPQRDAVAALSTIAERRGA